MPQMKFTPALIVLVSFSLLCSLTAAAQSETSKFEVGVQ